LSLGSAMTRSSSSMPLRPQTFANAIGTSVEGQEQTLAPQQIR
jgi:hypothetical protein